MPPLQGKKPSGRSATQKQMKIAFPPRRLDASGKHEPLLLGKRKSTGNGDGGAKDSAKKGLRKLHLSPSSECSAADTIEDVSSQGHCATSAAGPSLQGGRKDCAASSKGRKKLYTGTKAGLLKIRYREGKAGIQVLLNLQECTYREGIFFIKNSKTNCDDDLTMATG
jgi:hypothetical protein